MRLWLSPLFHQSTFHQFPSSISFIYSNPPINSSIPNSHQSSKLAIHSSSSIPPFPNFSPYFPYFFSAHFPLIPCPFLSTFFPHSFNSILSRPSLIYGPFVPRFPASLLLAQPKLSCLLFFIHSLSKLMPTQNWVDCQEKKKGNAKKGAIVFLGKIKNALLLLKFSTQFPESSSKAADSLDPPPNSSKPNGPFIVAPSTEKSTGWLFFQQSTKHSFGSLAVPFSFAPTP